MARASAREGGADALKLKDRMLDAAERLFGECGLEGVSLRQIAAEAGSKNHLAVQYHFGGKDEIAAAILERRLPSLEQRRGKLLAEAQAAGLLHDPKALLNVMFNPIAHETDTGGKHSYAGFLLGVNRHPALRALRLQMRDRTPLTNHVLDLLRDALTQVPHRLFLHRIACASDVYYQSLIALDRPLVAGGWLTNERDAMTEALELAHAVVSAPAGHMAEG